MTIPKFNNRPNHYITGYWISRSVAVDAFVFARCTGINEGMLNILTIKRSTTMRDDPNKYAVPSGYLDWNENGYESMIRELYEETSLYLPDHQNFNVFDNYKQPFYTNTKPTINRQNVVIMYITVLEFGRSTESFPKFIENFTSKETAEVKWMSWLDFTQNKLEWAFNHDKRIMDALTYYNTGQFNICFFNREMR